MEICAEHEWESEEENGALQIRLLQECVNWGVLQVCADIQGYTHLQSGEDAKTKAFLDRPDSNLESDRRG